MNNRYALIKNGIVENIIIVDDLNAYTPEEGYSLIAADDACHMNCKYENGQFVKNLDFIADKVRKNRNMLLSATDLWVVPDRFATFSEAKKQEILDYRQALRDISNQEGFPEEIQWPAKPQV
jgi:hypothetical protein